MKFSLPNQAALTSAAQIVYASMPATAQYAWPLLCEALGTEVWLKHENHTPTGAFKVRGGLVYLHELMQREPALRGVISATRGNHGQSIAYAARPHGIKVTIVVPLGNSAEKNAAMRALGADLIEHGNDFQESREHAMALAQQQGWHMVPSLHTDLVRGVATYWMEFFTAQPDLDVVYVPIGQGSGICGAVAARNALGLRTKLIGVVSSHALAYKLSFEQGKNIASPVSTVLADGMACRVPDDASLAVIFEHVTEIMAVSDEEIAAAMKLLFLATHNVAEGAGAAALAAALQNKAALAGLKVGLSLSGGNVDHDKYAEVLTQTRWAA
ncbi:threonine dehydratase [Undibacterium parvum]|uniref:Threonine dehydratase n=1 Tax=Undibacterium parvum TaxID=401471 RepID=A0A3Q9BNN2_9BURK|nr:threonine dehydratase [Undibacterium parvum]AZP11055.1 threonine dehydratase [Undibacterium parvum]